VVAAQVVADPDPESKVRHPEHSRGSTNFILESDELAAATQALDEVKCAAPLQGARHEASLGSWLVFTS
jgi:hypothetical protein